LRDLWRNQGARCNQPFPAGRYSKDIVAAPAIAKMIAATTIKLSVRLRLGAT
jgi:hypothetical protein